MENGICCICGKHRPLTFEHIPSKSSGNKKFIKIYEQSFLYEPDDEKFLEKLNNPSFDNLNSGSKSSKMRRGIGFNGTCEICNNEIKNLYDKEYTKLCNFVLSQIENNNISNSDKTKSVKIFFKDSFIPLYFVKSIICSLAVIYGEVFFNKYEDLRDFVLNKDSLNFNSKKYKLYMYHSKSKIWFRSEPYSIGAIDTQFIEKAETHLLNLINGIITRPVTYEWVAYPFGFILDVDNDFDRTNVTVLSNWVSNNIYSELEFYLNSYEKTTAQPFPLN